MVTKDIFKLTTYYSETNKYYYFFDGMFKIRNLSKLETLDGLNIPSSTYRINRKNSLLKNDNHKAILNFFNVNENLKDMIKCEKTLSELFSCLYFKQSEEKILEYKKQIDIYILDDNYLKPIFMLFRILIKIIMTKDIVNVLDNIKLDVDYISKFPGEYYENDFKVLFNIIMYFAHKSDDYLKDYEIDAKYPYLTWLYYHLRGSFNYYNHNYSEAIIYYKNAIKCYLNDLNVSRILECQINIAAMYNRINGYRETINTLVPLIEYALYETDNHALKCYSIMHYFIALMMVNDYEKIISTLNKLGSIELVNDVSAMVGIVASKILKIKVLNKILADRIKNNSDVMAIYSRVYYNKVLTKEFIENNKMYYYIDLIKEKIETSL